MTDIEKALACFGLSIETVVEPQEDPCCEYFCNQEEETWRTYSVLKFRCPAEDKSFDITFRNDGNFYGHLIKELIQKLSPVAYYSDPALHKRLQDQEDEIKRLNKELETIKAKSNGLLSALGFDVKESGK